nr:patatin family protein [Vibrio eleionomae]
MGQITKTALVVEGGAMRGIFASGVLDAFMEQDYQPFDLAIGVSAGASNLVGYLAHQPKRSFEVITRLATSAEFFNLRRFIHGGDLVDVRWLIDASNQQYPVDTQTLFDHTEFLAAATNVNTGHADYYRINSDNLADVLEATQALPIVYRHTPCFAGDCYTDGGVADSIPVREAYRRGARDITVILSHPADYTMGKTKNGWLLRRLLSRHPKLADSLMHRAENYNASLEFIHHPPKDATVHVIAPPSHFAVKRLTMKKPILDEGYRMGVVAGRNWLSQIVATE